ncbi:hypothetical protein [Microcoleus sp. S13_C3]|uniref:hypothetical protein n=1 Tax=Microcoleus sp. S13_C3 TaxID=3055409 RepID=UPI002FD6CC43
MSRPKLEILVPHPRFICGLNLKSQISNRVTGAIAQKTQDQAAWFPQATELLKIVKVLPLIASIYLEYKPSRCRAL